MGAPAWRAASADQAPREIVVIKPSSLGDVVHTLPAVALLKKRWPESRIRWLINPEWAPLLEGNPDVDEVVIFPRREFRGVRGWFRIAPWARELRARVDSDLVLDFQGLLRSALIAKLCRGNIGRIAGLSDAREGARFFYDLTVNVSGRSHAVDRYLALVAALGIEADPTEELAWPLPIGSRPAGIELPSQFVLLHPYSRGKGKSLSIEDVEIFCRQLFPLPVVVVGKADRKLPHFDHVIDLVNRTSLGQLIFTIRRAAFVVSVDSGPMHIAAALTSKLLSIHTWSDPLKVGPYRPEAWIWKAGRISQIKGTAASETADDISAVANLVKRQVGS